MTVVALGLWLAIVVTTAAHHEFWRDEVRPWTLAGEARSPLDLFTLVQYDGHPFLWYLMLYLARAVSGSPLVLPVVGVSVAFAAVCVFAVRAPFALWFRILFLFTGLPLYEYSVMARNYGIGLLLVFLAAVCYPRRETAPVPLAAILALLANTSAYAAGLTVLICFVWVFDHPDASRFRPLSRLVAKLPVLALPFFGCVVCALWARPQASTILTATYSRLDPMDLCNTCVVSLVRPEYILDAVIPEGTPAWIGRLLAFGCILGLWRRPALVLASLLALCFFGFMQLMVFPGSYRHQGLLLAFFLFLYWIAFDLHRATSPALRPARAFRAGLYGCLGLLLAANVFLGHAKIVADLREPLSTGPALGAFLATSDRFRQSTIVAEPDFSLESLPLYASNEIFLPRERRFGRTVSWTTDSAPRLSLGELLAAARRVQLTRPAPVLIALGHRNAVAAVPTEPGTVQYSYNRTFTYTPAEVEDFLRSTVLVGDFRTQVPDDDFLLFSLR